MGCLPGSPAKHWSRSAKEAERAALRRLSIFVGVFGLEAARAVAAGDGMGGERVEDAVVGLVEKSLVAVDSTGSATRYRLLDTTRAYALGKLADSGDAGQVAQFHAAHFCDFLVRVNAGASPLSRAEASAAYGDQVGNVRAALVGASARAAIRRPGRRSPPRRRSSCGCRCSPNAAAGRSGPSPGSARRCAEPAARWGCRRRSANP